MASYTPTATCNTLATRIADELARSDLTSEIQSEINSAILHYSSEEFWGTEGSWTTNTTVNTRLYSVAVNFRSISSVVASYNSGNYNYPVVPKTLQYINGIDFGNSSWAAYPRYYVYLSNQIRVYPPTLASGTITVYGQIDLLPLVFNQTTAWPQSAAVSSATPTIILDSNSNIQTCTTSGTTGSSAPTFSTTLNATTTDNTAVWTCTGAAVNWWTTEAEELIRSRALSQIAGRYVGDEQSLRYYQQAERDALMALRGANRARGMSSGYVQASTF